MITSFKALTVWQRADQLACRVFDLTDTFPRAYLYDLMSQLRRAALSVPTNLASLSEEIGKMLNGLVKSIRKKNALPPLTQH